MGDCSGNRRHSGRGIEDGCGFGCPGSATRSGSAARPGSANGSSGPSSSGRATGSRSGSVRPRSALDATGPCARHRTGRAGWCGRLGAHGPCGARSASDSNPAGARGWFDRHAGRRTRARQRLEVRLVHLLTNRHVVFLALVSDLHHPRRDDLDKGDPLRVLADLNGASTFKVDGAAEHADHFRAAVFGWCLWRRRRWGRRRRWWWRRNLALPVLWGEEQRASRKARLIRPLRCLMLRKQRRSDINRVYRCRRAKDVKQQRGRVLHQHHRTSTCAQHRGHQHS